MLVRLKSSPHLIQTPQRPRAAVELIPAHNVTNALACDDDAPKSMATHRHAKATGSKIKGRREGVAYGMPYDHQRPLQALPDLRGVDEQRTHRNLPLLQGATQMRPGSHMGVNATDLLQTDRPSTSRPDLAVEHPLDDIGHECGGLCIDD
jgi:hypothetical protein